MKKYAVKIVCSNCGDKRWDYVDVARSDDVPDHMITMCSTGCEKVQKHEVRSKKLV